MGGVTPFNSSLEHLETNPPEHLSAKDGAGNPDDPHIDYRKLGRGTAYDPAHATPLESTFRHSGWAVRRRKVWEGLKATGQTENRLNRFAQCGSALFTYVEVSDGSARLTCNSCKDRFCQACGANRSRVIVAALDGMMQKKTTRFITLTQRASATPLADQISRLYRNFSVLRRKPWWKQHVVGGAAFLEVKVGKGSGLWHPHLHIIAEGIFIDQRELCRAWHEVTGDSFIAWVSACDDKTARARYVTKYVTKPASTEVFSDAKRLAEMITAMKGRRLCSTFGTWRGVELDPDVPIEGTWKSAGSLEDVMHRAVGGCLASLGILRQLQARYPTFPLVVDFFDRHGRPPSTA